MATAGDHTRQLLVTTCEDQLARNLARAGAAEVRYVRTALCKQMRTRQVAELA